MRIQPVSEFYGMTKAQLIDDALFYRRLARHDVIMGRTDAAKRARRAALRYIVEANAGEK